MKIYKPNINSCSGGALLFSIVTALVLSFTCATMSLLLCNQYRMVNNEIESVKTDYLLKAGYIDAFNKLRRGEIPGENPYLLSIADCPPINVGITENPAGSGYYDIEVTL